MSEAVEVTQADQRWRKKPVEIDARQWDGTERSAKEIIAWMDGAGRFVPTMIGERDPPELEIITLEDGKRGQARHVASPRDWIIRGVQSEYYPCKPDIFAATYEPARHRHTAEAPLLERLTALEADLAASQERERVARDAALEEAAAVAATQPVPNRDAIVKAIRNLKGTPNG